MSESKHTQDRYARIREALAMGPTPGPFSVTRSFSPGNQELILRLTYKDEYGLPEHYCTVRNQLGGELGTEANAAHISACDPDTIQALLEERDALCEALQRILDNEASDWKAVEAFGGYVLDEDLREFARAALAKTLGR